MFREIISTSDNPIESEPAARQFLVRSCTYKLLFQNQNFKYFINLLPGMEYQCQSLRGQGVSTFFIVFILGTQNQVNIAKFLNHHVWFDKIKKEVGNIS